MEKPKITVEPNWEYSVKYRFTDDPEDMVREWKEPPTWDEKNEVYCILPAFPGKSIIVLGW
jgi:hypothetical protein